MNTMASSGKRKTTMAKLMREAKLRERKVEKNARKLARQQEQAAPHDPAAAYGPVPADLGTPETSEEG
jgi:hypothetical protein